MATCVWRGLSRTIAQVWKGTITTTTTGHTYTVTLTDLDDGGTDTFSYALVAADTTVTLAAESFVAAWNKSNLPLVRRITASNSAGQIILTATTAGEPFSVSATGGTGTWSGTGVTTASSSPNDFAIAFNWDTEAVPTSSDTIIIPANTPSILYNLNQASVTGTTIDSQTGFAGDVGRWVDGKLYYLSIGATTLHIGGQGSLWAINVGSSVVSPTVEHYGSPGATGRKVVYIKGSALGSVSGYGNVGIGAYAADSFTVTSGWNITGGSWQIGGRSGTGTVSGTTLRMTAGDVETWRAIPTNNTFGGNLRVQANPGSTYNIRGGRMYPNGTGTYATVLVENTGVVDLSEDQRTKTFTNTTVRGEGSIPFGSVITYTNPPDLSGKTFGTTGGAATD